MTGRASNLLTWFCGEGDLRLVSPLFTGPGHSVVVMMVKDVWDPPELDRDRSKFLTAPAESLQPVIDIPVILQKKNDSNKIARQIYYNILYYNILYYIVLIGYCISGSIGVVGLSSVGYRRNIIENDVPLIAIYLRNVI